MKPGPATFLASALSGTAALCAPPINPLLARTPTATFAVVIGVNKSIDPRQKLLRYADDDAARYVEVFRAMDARTYVLTRLDQDTLALHPQVASEALDPIKSNLDRVIANLSAQVLQAKARGIRTILYFAYAGHGSVTNGRGYISLEDARLTGSTIQTEVLGRVHADLSHVIIDACNSYFLATTRGPGGEREELHGFTQVGGLADDDSVGLLFSTSSARETHEWSGIQAGVFSHEVRSGFQGPADADHDGQVSYREMAAFVDRANAGILNEKFRPDVYARPPKETEVLVDLRERLSQRIEIPDTAMAHYVVEDSRGVRIADLHNGTGAPAYLLRPLHAGNVYLRRADDETEYLIPPSIDTPLSLADLLPREAQVRVRGAADDAFDHLFQLPFSWQNVTTYRLRWITGVPLESPQPAATSGRWYAYSILGAASLFLVGGAVALASSAQARDAIGSSSSQDVVATANEKVRTRNLIGGIALGVAGVAGAIGVTWLVWPRNLSIDIQASSNGAALQVMHTF